QKVARKEDRPLAVFVGSGDAGYNGVSRQGTLTTGVRKLLKDGYVCVYLDADKPGCQKLIDALEITRGNGLVVSDRTGQLQAFHHDGTLSDAALARQLQRFSNPTFAIRTTETNGTSRVSYYPSNGYTNGYTNGYATNGYGNGYGPPPVFWGGGRGC